MPRRESPRPRKTRSAGQRRALLDALDGAEAKQVLRALLDAHPDLVMEITARAEDQLGEVTPKSVAYDVACALADLSVEDIWERAGSHADGSYVEPTEAAWEVVEEAVAPFLADLRRRVELGRRAEATAICQGMLLALYRVSQADGEFLEGHSPDTLEEIAAKAVEVWKKRRRGGAGSHAPARERAAMGDFVSRALPEWSSFLSRMMGGAPAGGGGGRRKR